ncbi:uncharacterized protein LOC142633879 [Castanea sativa]|uniref:uncharacterized protein LOC142633879 n=1 Tax=Castanea sativa TaxID=21020 RepID=UPI003F6530FC
MDMLESNFIGFEAAMVSTIPLCHTNQPDELIWPHNPNGEYLVKSGYKFLQLEEARSRPGQSDFENLKPLWQSIWSLSVSSKVKHLVWRAAKNSLLMKMSLVRRKVNADDCCEICQGQQEDVLHALYRCPKLEELRALNPLWNHSRLKQTTSFLDLIGSIFTENRESAFFSMANNCAGVGVAIRNGCGQVMVSLSQQIPLPSTVIEVEALAARRALILAQEIGFTRVVLEGDSQTLITALKTSSHTLAHFGHIAQDIRYLASSFSDVRYTHVRRQCNTVAHSLTRQAILSPFLQVWMEDVPPELADVLQVDFQSLD